MNTLYRAGRTILFFFMLCALLISTDVSAQTGGTIKLDAQAGFDGACKTGTWLPVRVTVENSGADFNARVQASYKNDQNGQSIYATDISLPATSRKEFFLYVNSSGSMRDFRVSVLDGNSALAQKKLNVSCAGNEDLIFGILADDPTPYNILNDIRPLSGGKTRLAQLTISDLPNQFQGWAALDALVVANVDTGKLSAEQKQALQLWLANGGKLFITGGINWQTTTAGLQDFMPVKIASTKNAIGLPALSAYVKDAALLDHESILASGALQDGARVLVAQDQIPLLVEKQIGYGKVIYFAADPALQPLSDWGGIKKIYEHLLAFTPHKPSWANAAWDSNQANNAISALPELNLPSFFYICCWLGIYILAIGPINYLILRRAKRTELAWVTVPVLVILFSCIAYAFGFAYRGVNPILNRFALAQGFDGVPQARINNLAGVYSPSRATYNIQTQDQFMLYQPHGMNTDLQGSGDWLSLKNESGTTLPEARVEIGGMISVGAEGVAPALKFQQDLTLTVTRSGYDLTGNVTNANAQSLLGAILVTPNDWKILGDFKPNETKKINISFGNLTASPTDMYVLIQNLGLSTSYPISATADKKLIRRSAFFQANVIPDNSFAPIISGFYLMGWVDNVPAPIDLQNQKSDALDTALYFQKLAPNVATSSQSFVLSSSLYDWESSNGALTTYQIPADGYEIRFQPSQPVDFSAVDNLTFQIQSNVAPNRMIVSFWNFETNAWKLVSLTTSSFMDIPQAAQYVGADGEIRMKIAANQNDYVQINAINFFLTVKP